MFASCISTTGSLALNGIKERCIYHGSRNINNIIKDLGQSFIGFTGRNEISYEVLSIMKQAGTIAAAFAFVSFAPFTVLPLKVALVAFLVTFIAHDALLNAAPYLYTPPNLMEYSPSTTELALNILREGGRTTLLASIHPLALALYLGCSLPKYQN